MSRTSTSLLISSLFTAFTQQAVALENFKVSDAKVTPGLEVGVGFVDNIQQAFGAKTSAYGLPIDQSGQRWEGYLKPSLAIEVPTEAAGTFFGKTSMVSSLSRGDSDGLGYTRDDPTDSDWDDGYVGWRNGALSWLGADALSVSVGRQPFMIGNGFLLGEGHVDQGHEGAYWLGPRRAFDWSVLGQLDLNQFHADLFHLKSRVDIDEIDFSQNLTIKGLNLEWRSPNLGTYGTSMLWTQDNSVPSRDGLQVKDVRGSFNPLPDIPGLNIAAEYVWQKNEHENISANAWYLEANYTFKEAAWQPVLTYRHSTFSKEYDSLLYGYSGDYGYWFQGEIVGENMLFNMNEKVNMLKLTAYPSREFRVGVVAYQYVYDEAPEGVDSKDFAKEVDFYIDYMPDSHWTLGALYGVAKPDEGGEQTFENDKLSNLFEAYATYKF